MSSIALDLVTYLDPLVSETAGTNLFEGPPSELPVTGVWLTHYGGEAGLDRVFATSLVAPGVEVSRVQLFIRGTVMATVEALSETYHALLDGFHGTANSRTIYFMNSIDGMPYSLGQDQRGNWRFVANYRVQHKR